MHRYLVHLLEEVPVPPPGKLEIAFPIGRLRLFCARPRLNTFPKIMDVSVANNFL